MEPPKDLIEQVEKEFEEKFPRNMDGQDNRYINTSIANAVSLAYRRGAEDMGKAIEIKEAKREYQTVRRCAISREGLDWFANKKGKPYTQGRIVGESRNKKCWIVLWDGFKNAEPFDKSFIMPLDLGIDEANGFNEALRLVKSKVTIFLET